MSGRCGGCPHVAHKGICSRRGPSGCVPWDGGGGMRGFVCYGRRRPPCPCAWRVCKCGADVAMATLDTDPSLEVPVIRGSAADPAGDLDIWRAEDGGLRCAEIDPGGTVPAGHWRGREHDGPCQQIHREAAAG